MKIPHKSDSEIRDKIKKLTGKDIPTPNGSVSKAKPRPQLEKPDFVSPDSVTPAKAEVAPKNIDTSSAAKIEAPSAPKIDTPKVEASPVPVQGKTEVKQNPIEDKVELKSQHMQKNLENLNPEDKLNEINPAIKSDVGLNRPGDPETQEKLKSLLKNGGFNFSESERKTLSSILNKP